MPYAACNDYWLTMTLQRRSSCWPKFQAMIWGVKTLMNGGASVAYLRAGSSISVTRRSPTALSRKRRLPPIPIIVQNFTSCRAGSRCVLCRIRSRPFSILRKSTKAQAIRLCWRGRAFEAAGQFGEMKAQYAAAARYPTAYYGQLARARIGVSEIALRSPQPQPMGGVRSELLQAADMLYAIGEFDLLLSFVSDLAETSSDVATLSALGELTARHNDAQAMLAIGKTALARGLATERYAFPEIGVPAYSPIAPPIDRCMVYSIVRTESAFDQRDTSPANAVGLMQVTPEAARDTAKRFGVGYDWKRVVSDPVYNTQMGAAEISALFREYTGSYIMTFAGYNAGRGRVREWVAKHGDPRNPKVDAVDWVERIPLAETRNYVQRVIENLQVYAARLGASVATVEPNLHRVMTIDPQTKPTYVNATPH